MKKPKTRIPAMFFTIGILMAFLCGLPQGQVYGQDTGISVQIKAGSMQDAFKSIEKASNMRFFYSNEDLSDKNVPALAFEKAALSDILNSLLKNSGLTWKLEGRNILVKKEKLPIPSKPYTLTGKVTDKKGEPLAGVTVFVKGTTTGVYTEADGSYSVKVQKPASTTLSFSSLGLVQQDIKLAGQKVLNIVMEEETNTLEEVYVTGYFTRRKDSYTGAATSFSGDKIREVASGNVLATLSTIDPSFKMLDGALGSDPNSIPEFQIHGAGNLQTEYENSPNMPTFILDGFEASPEKIFDLDPNRVASITVLKDASATAIYGSRAANGVVVVETKNPELGKMKVSYNFTGDFSFADLSGYDLMDAGEKLEYERLAGLYNHFNSAHNDELQELYNERLKLVASGVNTDWIKKPIKPVGFSHKHSLLLEGGDKALRYGLDLNYQDKSGVVKESGRDNLGIGIKLQYRLKNFKFMNNLTYDNVKQYDSPYGSFSQYTYMNPYLYPYDENGNVRQVIPVGEEYELNPMYNATLSTKQQTKYQNFVDNFSVEWDVFNGFKLKGAVSVNKKSSISDNFKPAGHNIFYDKEVKGSYTKRVVEDFSYDANVMASYSRTMKKHTIIATAIWNIMERKSDSFSTTAYNFPNENMDHIGMGTEYIKGDKPSGNYEISRLMGIVGNFNYSYDDRYLVDFSVRSDGSSMFGSSKRWGTFGSAGLAWNIHNEKWFKNSKSVNELKIRASWGTTGGQNFYPYQAMMMYSYKNGYINDATYDGYMGTLIKAFGNPDLKWQQTEKLNVGVDFTLLDRRLSGYFNVYKNVSKSVLIDVLLAPSTGFEAYKDNLGEIENKGIEFNIRGVVLRNTNKDLQWDLFFNIVKNRNRLMKINDALAAFNKSQDNSSTQNENRKPVVRYQEGQSINTIWANESLGIDPNTGEEVFLTKDGRKTNVWSTANYKPLGCRDPKFEGNFGTMFSYKGFMLNAYFRYSYGGQIYNHTLVDKVENVDPHMNADRRVLYDRWKQPGDIAKYKSIKNTTATMPTSRFIEDENFISLSSLNISYQFERDLLKRAGIERLKLSLIGNEIFRASTVKMERGTNYPFARNYSISAQITF